MTANASWKERLRGKWQFPLLAVSAAALTHALLSPSPAPPPFSVEPALAGIDTMIDGGVYPGALRAAEHLLARKDIPKEGRAQLTLRVARALSGSSSEAGKGSTGVDRRILRSFEVAKNEGVALSTPDQKSWAEALERTGSPTDAIAHYEEAIASADSPSLDLKRHALDLRLHALETPLPESRLRLEEFLSETGDRPDDALWAVGELVDVLHRSGADSETASVLARYGEILPGAEDQAELEYLKALTLFRTGAAEEAELLLRALRNREGALGRDDPRATWLLGRVLLGAGGDGRPEEAIAFFTETLRDAGLGPYAPAAEVGIAESLAALERDGEALEHFQAARTSLERAAPAGPVDAAVLRVVLIRWAQTLRVQGRLGAALDYLNLAGPLVDRSNAEAASAYWELRAQLAEAQAQENMEPSSEEGDASDHADFDVEARRAFLIAAQSYEELERICTLDEPRAAEAHIRAAEMTASANSYTAAEASFAAFIRDHPSSMHLPRAWARLGQVRQALSKLDAAANAFRECITQFPRTLYGLQSLIPLAETYIAMGVGDESLDQADRTLRRILEDSELFRPESQEFTDALFLQGHVASLKGEHERAIAILSEAVVRYPNDARLKSAKFLLADSYRQSGMVMKEAAQEAASAGEGLQIRDDCQARLQQAQRLFREVVESYESRAAKDLDRLENVYYRHALLFEADCLFESVRHAEALKLYLSAVSVLGDTPDALAAYVQIVNCHVFLGQPKEARAALTRASVLLEHLPDDAFARSFSRETREDWRRYLDWLGKAELF